MGTSSTDLGTGAKIILGVAAVGVAAYLLRNQLGAAFSAIGNAAVRLCTRQPFDIALTQLTPIFLPDPAHRPDPAQQDVSDLPATANLNYFVTDPAARITTITLQVTDKNGTVVWTQARNDPGSRTPGPHPIANWWDGRRSGGGFVPPAGSDYTVTITASDGGEQKQDSLQTRVPVLPKIQIAAPKIVIIRSAIQPRDLRLAVTVGTTAAFDGDGLLSLTHAGGMSLFTADNGGVGRPLPATVTNAELLSGQPLYLETDTSSGAVGTTVLTLSLQNGTIPFRNEVTDTMTAVELSLKLFRGTTILPVVPFHNLEDPARLDAALPDPLQNQAAALRPGNLDAAFTFPVKTDYADKPLANQDPGVFRFALVNTPDALTQTPVDTVLKVLKSDGSPIDMESGRATCAGTATHTGGMPSQFQKQPNGEWWSPYLRVATTGRSNGDPSRNANYGVVHSLPPIGSANMLAGRHLLRTLRVKGAVSGVEFSTEFSADYTMGNPAYARIPIKFFYVSTTLPTTLKLQTARDKIHNLNQYWAAQGLEFILDDEAHPFDNAAPPSRTLISIGEFTGRDVVSDHPFSIEIAFSAKLPGMALANADPIVVNVPADQSPGEVADLIQNAIAAWIPGGVAELTGLQLDADIFDIAQPRAYLTFDQCDLSTGVPNTKVLPLVGARGPADIVMRATAGAPESLQITGLRVTRPGPVALAPQPDTDVDIHVPPVDKPYHDAAFIPHSSATRHWVRTYSPPNKNYLSVIVEAYPAFDRRANGAGWPHLLCENGFGSLYDATEATMKSRFDPVHAAVNFESRSEALTLMNFGLWTDPSAKYTLFLSELAFRITKNDLQHEIGHVLSDLDHTIGEPEWFYEPELMHSGGPAPEALLCNANQKIYVDCVVNNGGWNSTYLALPNGYGQAIRDLIPAAWIP